MNWRCKMFNFNIILNILNVYEMYKYPIIILWRIYESFVKKKQKMNTNSTNNIK